MDGAESDRLTSGKAMSGCSHVHLTVHSHPMARGGRPTKLPASWASAHVETACFPDGLVVRFVFFLWRGFYSFWRGLRLFWREFTTPARVLARAARVRRSSRPCVLRCCMPAIVVGGKGAKNCKLLPIPAYSGCNLATLICLLLSSVITLLFWV